MGQQAQEITCFDGHGSIEPTQDLTTYTPQKNLGKARTLSSSTYPSRLLCGAVRSQPQGQVADEPSAAPWPKLLPSPWPWHVHRAAAPMPTHDTVLQQLELAPTALPDVLAIRPMRPGWILYQCAPRLVLLAHPPEPHWVATHSCCWIWEYLQVWPHVKSAQQCSAHADHEHVYIENLFGIALADHTHIAASCTPHQSHVAALDCERMSTMGLSSPQQRDLGTSWSSQNLANHEAPPRNAQNCSSDGCIDQTRRICTI
mmetsp:Transcript_7643/g.18079  ORF Transcript_7643/g.18079 Transcript_7643/m.18079 type:complete len:258 (-) Transcript_7643:98-871(-)